MDPVEHLVTLDVREELRSGGEPLPRILNTVAALSPGQGLRLLATFEPKPLYAVLGQRGFSHQSQPLGEGDWEVIFSPPAVPKETLDTSNPIQPESTSLPSFDSWPKAAVFLDNRNLLPPDPLMRILEALQQMQKGNVLETLLDRDPVLLYRELESRGDVWHIDKEDPEGVRLWIKVGSTHE